MFKLLFTYATLSFDGEKPIPAVGAECCFDQEICTFDKKKRKRKINNISKHKTNELSNRYILLWPPLDLTRQKWKNKKGNYYIFQKTIWIYPLEEKKKKKTMENM